MIHNKKVIVVMPAYNAEQTLEQTYRDVPPGFIDEIILVDDASRDNTAELSRRLGLRTIVHPKNLGYGGNQKTCYREALKLGADVVIMLHPDYQYTPKLLIAMASLVAIGLYDIVLGSRILGGGALKGGMPLYKYISNRVLTLIQNIMLGAKLSEYHTGYRAFSRRVLMELPLEENSNDFIFDNQMLAQALMCGYTIGEISCPTKYFKEASSINLTRSIIYGLGVLMTSMQFVLHKSGIKKYRIFSTECRKLSFEEG
ncbi:MAG TPA: glycosyltransferase family 2 protein [Syntrophorhabdaceae bacterium]|nr:glycosyltransferase family 2 protein [Syntrophorhabdaceae bacterium]HOL04759.1 glycosyltransferase family 2 protein [Syntrophorhabdaceae bacterium]HON86098.1 glycosyltransferase family 2 protein [Syntrophorhabdaceae bacterium]HOT42328.1 glycosyltransferase family 2 protein [Syntrophorhabdaceae bacterium]HPC67407.1 glycosyltransferase family 2 protein [Syntrophorhabdaceae bacterium]